VRRWSRYARVRVSCLKGNSSCCLSVFSRIEKNGEELLRLKASGLTDEQLTELVTCIHSAC